MSLIHSLDEISKDIESTKEQARVQQRLYFKVISGVVKLHEKHRVKKNHAISDELRDLLNSLGIKIIQGTAGFKYEDIPKHLKGRQAQDTWEIDLGFSCEK